MVKIGDVYCVYIDKLKKYGAYQIIGVCEKSSYYVALDYCNAELPNENELLDIEPLRNNVWRNHNSLFAGWVDQIVVPKNYIYVTNQKPVISVPKQNFYVGRKYPKGEEVVRISQWNDIPKEQIKKYKKYDTSGEIIEINGVYKRKSCNCIDQVLLNSIRRVQELDQFPCLTHINVKGNIDDLLEYIKTRNMIRVIIWNKTGKTCVDLRQTPFERIELDATGVKDIYIDDNIETLKLYGCIEKDLIIHHPNEGQSLYLMVELKNNQLSGYGLKKLESIFVSDIYKIDGNIFQLEFSQIKKIVLKGNPGVIYNLSELGKCNEIKEIFIDNLNGFYEKDIEWISSASQIQDIWLESVPKIACENLKKKLKKRTDLEYLSVVKLRSEEWFEENKDNPFREWNGSDFVPKEAYEKSLKLYKKLRKSIKNIKYYDEIKEAVKTYIHGLNKLNLKYEYFIETEERETIFDALNNLLIDTQWGNHINEILKYADEYRQEW